MYGLIFDGLEKWVVSKLSPQSNDNITPDDERGSFLWEEILRATVVSLENEWTFNARGDSINSERQAEKIEQQEGLLDEGATLLRTIIDDDGGHFVTNQKYSDQLFHVLVNMTAQKLNSGADRVLEEYGYFFLDYIRQKDDGAYKNILACQGNNLRDWISNVSDFHAHMSRALEGKASFSFPELFCADNESETDERTTAGGDEAAAVRAAASTSDSSGGHQVQDIPSSSSAHHQFYNVAAGAFNASRSFRLFYRSVRGSFMAPFVIGIIRNAAADYFDSHVLVEPLTVQDDSRGVKYTSWRIKMVSISSGSSAIVPNSTIAAPAAAVGASGVPNGGVGLTPPCLRKVFPFHIALDRQLRIVQVGSGLEKLLLLAGDDRQESGVTSNTTDSAIINIPLERFFVMTSPTSCALSWDEIMLRKDELFEFSVAGRPRCFRLSGSVVPDGCVPVGERYAGQPSTLIFFLQPNVNNIDDMMQHSLTWSDFGRHSSQQKLILMAEHLKREAGNAIHSKHDAELSKQSLQMKRMFVRYVSHEIRTPLNTVAMGLELLKATVLPRLAVVEEDRLHAQASLSLLKDDTLLSSSIFGSFPTKVKTADQAATAVSVASAAGGIERSSESSSPSPIAAAGGGAELPRIQSSGTMTIQSLVTRILGSRRESLLMSISGNSEGYGGGTAGTPIGKDASTALAGLELNVVEMIDQVKESCDVAINILNDLLLYEKLEGDATQLDRKCEPILPLVFDVVKTFQIQARHARLKLELTTDDATMSANEADSPKAFVDVDKAKVSQALRNLLSNAIKYSRDAKEIHSVGPQSRGSRSVSARGKPLPATSSSSSSSGDEGKITIHVSVIRDNDPGGDTTRGTAENIASSPLATSLPPLSFVRVEVIDCGPGISPENQEILLRNIVQFDPSELQGGGGGSGLGLYIAKSIVDLHGGRMGLSSAGETGNGTTFYLDLPLHSEENVLNVDAASMSSRSGGSARAETKSPLALITLQPLSARSSVLATEPFPVAAVAVTANSDGSSTHSSSSSPRRRLTQPRSTAGDDAFLVSSMAFQQERMGGGGRTSASPSPMFILNSTSNRPARTRRPSSSVETKESDRSGGPSPKAFTPGSVINDRTQETPPMANAVPSTASILSNATATNTATIPRVIDLSRPRRKKDEEEDAAASSSSPRTMLSRRAQSMRIGASTAATVVTSDIPNASGSPRSRPHSRQQSRRQSFSGGGVSPSLRYGGDGKVDSSGGESSDQSDRSVSTIASTSMSPRVAAGSASSRSSKKQNAARKYRVLVVDDSASSRKMVVRYLKVAKISQLVKEAADGDEAVRIIEKSLKGDPRSRFDVILMDFVMPVMDGPTATKRIRELGFAGPIIGITGNVLPEDIRLFKGCGANDVLGKPLEMEKLRALIEDFCFVNSEQVQGDLAEAGGSKATESDDEQGIARQRGSDSKAREKKQGHRHSSSATRNSLPLGTSVSVVSDAASSSLDDLHGDAGESFSLTAYRATEAEVVSVVATTVSNVVESGRPGFSAVVQGGHTNRSNENFHIENLEDDDHPSLRDEKSGDVSSLMTPLQVMMPSSTTHMSLTTLTPQQYTPIHQSSTPGAGSNLAVAATAAATTTTSLHQRYPRRGQPRSPLESKVAEEKVTSNSPNSGLGMWNRRGGRADLTHWGSNDGAVHQRNNAPTSINRRLSQLVSDVLGENEALAPTAPAYRRSRGAPSQSSSSMTGDNQRSGRFSALLAPVLRIASNRGSPPSATPTGPGTMPTQSRSSSFFQRAFSAMSSVGTGASGGRVRAVANSASVRPDVRASIELRPRSSSSVNSFRVSEPLGLVSSGRADAAVSAAVVTPFQVSHRPSREPSSRAVLVAPLHRMDSAHQEPAAGPASGAARHSPLHSPRRASSVYPQAVATSIMSSAARSGGGGSGTLVNLVQRTFRGFFPTSSVPRDNPQVMPS